jgi:ribosomal protein S18 acetylase RimI-like enzyme
MLIDLKGRLRESAVRELLAWSVFPDPDRVDEVIETYEREPDLAIAGLEEDGQWIGLIGYRLREGGVLQVLHLAVDPQARGLGYGRGLVLEAIAKEQPKVVAVETDEENVDFFRNIGFTIESLGPTPTGAERFRCVFVTDDVEEADS